MARLDIEFPDDLFSGLEELFDDVAPKMINEALPVYKVAVENSVKQSISSAPDNVKRQTGGLEKSVSILPAKATKTEAYVGSVSFQGYDSKGSPNAVKALGLEFGNSHEVAKPFLARAGASCEAKVKETMQNVFEQEVSKWKL